MPAHMIPMEDRLANYMPVPEAGCWLWQGTTGSKGYGLIKIAKRMDGAHRASWRLHRGPIPDGLSVLHKCDTRSCINPEHLFLGTHDENMKDMVSKGRSIRNPGELNGASKITAEDVISIRLDARSHNLIAADYGISRSSVGLIKNRINWSHIE